MNFLDGFDSFKNRIVEERKARQGGLGDCSSFGVRYLDEALGGIYPSDLILYGAKSGIGKTQLATITATANAAEGRRVHFFALEAEQNEIEKRIKYQVISKYFYRLSPKDRPPIHLNYQDWYYGKYGTRLDALENAADEALEELYPGLHTFYSSEDYSLENFERDFLAIRSETDLVVLDHIHYFDFEDQNENRALKQAVKRIRDLALTYRKPIVLVSHLRKSDQKKRTLVPDMDEFHGSSDLVKIATKVITLGPFHEDNPSSQTRWPTIFRICKSRVDGSRCRYAALLGFDTESMSYDRGYQLGRITNLGETLTEITKQNELPFWAKSANIESDLL